MPYVPEASEGNKTPEEVPGLVKALFRARVSAREFGNRAALLLYDQKEGFLAKKGEAASEGLGEFENLLDQAERECAGKVGPHSAPYYEKLAAPLREAAVEEAKKWAGEEARRLHLGFLDEEVAKSAAALVESGGDGGALAALYRKHAKALESLGGEKAAVVSGGGSVREFALEFRQKLARETVALLLKVDPVGAASFAASLGEEEFGPGWEEVRRELASPLKVSLAALLAGRALQRMDGERGFSFWIGDSGFPPEVKELAERIARLRLAAEESGRIARERARAVEVRKALSENGGDPALLSPELLSGLPDSLFDELLLGKKAGDPATVKRLTVEAASDPEGFLEMDLTAYAHLLGMGELDNFMTFKSEVKALKARRDDAGKGAGR